jgi:uncharacterized metal-binding protein
MANCNCNSNNTLVFSCSGAADVGALADKTARVLNLEGKAKMFCSVGIGGKVDGIIEKTKIASTIIAIDGCTMDCMKKSLENAGFKKYNHVRITDHGFVKGSTPVDETAVEKIKNIILNTI